jgi:hypothetical protein
MTKSRKQCTSGDHCETRTLQEAIYCLLHHSAVPLAAIASAIGVRPGYLMDAANPDREDTQFQTRLVAPTKHVARNEVVIAQLARDCGGVFVATPDVSGDDSEIAMHTAAVLREVADVIQAPAKALAGDNRISASELTTIEAEIDEAITALLGLKYTVRRKAGVAESVQAHGKRA